MAFTKKVTRTLKYIINNVLVRFLIRSWKISKLLIPGFISLTQLEYQHQLLPSAN